MPAMHCTHSILLAPAQTHPLWSSGLLRSPQLQRRTRLRSPSSALLSRSYSAAYPPGLDGICSSSDSEPYIASWLQVCFYLSLRAYKGACANTRTHSGSGVLLTARGRAHSTRDAPLAPTAVAAPSLLLSRPRRARTPAATPHSNDLAASARSGILAFALACLSRFPLHTGSRDRCAHCRRVQGYESSQASHLCGMPQRRGSASVRARGLASAGGGTRRLQVTQQGPHTAITRGPDMRLASTCVAITVSGRKAGSSVDSCSRLEHTRRCSMLKNDLSGRREERRRAGDMEGSAPGGVSTQHDQLFPPLGHRTAHIRPALCEMLICRPSFCFVTGMQNVLASRQDAQRWGALHQRTDLPPHNASEGWRKSHASAHDSLSGPTE